MVLDIDKLNAFLKKIESFPKMWNSLETTIAAYYKKSDGEWICLSLVFHASERAFDSSLKILYEIPDKFKIIHKTEAFSFKSFILRFVPPSEQCGPLYPLT